MWVNGWGRVMLSEQNMGVLDMQYYICIGRKGRVEGWVRVPARATWMWVWVEGVAEPPP